MKAKTTVYWVTTALLVLGGVAGGMAQLTHQQPNIEGLRVLGYPAYLATILGVWKLLGAAAIAAPGLKRLKEWAYAGYFFVMTGAVASHVLGRDAPWRVLAPLLVAVCTVASWALRPRDRVLGTLFAEGEGSESATGAGAMGHTTPAMHTSGDPQRG